MTKSRLRNTVYVQKMTDQKLTHFFKIRETFKIVSKILPKSDTFL